MRFFFVYIFASFSLKIPLMKMGGKKKQTKTRNVHCSMDQTATGLLGTKRFSWPKLRRPSSWAMAATGLHGHLDLAPLWTQLLHFHHFRVEISKAGACASSRGGACSWPFLGLFALHPDESHSWELGSSLFLNLLAFVPFSQFLNSM